MADAFDKADGWRGRADELRRRAEESHEPIARDSLLEMADTADHHARTLEEAALTFRRIPRLARRLRARFSGRNAAD